MQRPLQVNHATVELLLNVGTGAVTEDEPLFDAPRPFDLGVGIVSLVLDDLNGDRHLDIAALNAEDDLVTIRLGYGDGSFTSAVMYATGEDPVAISTAQFPGDPAPDLVTANRLGDEDYVYVLRNDSVAAQRDDDCNRNRRPDSCDIADDPDLDSDRGGILDSCSPMSLPGRPPE